MSAATKPLLRWSSVRACPRKAVYEWEGAPARERTVQEEGHLWRGKSVGRDYTCLLATQMGATIWVASGHDYWVPPDLRAGAQDRAEIFAELQIEWPLGVGHADIYLPETRTIVEILSSAYASDQMIRSKQLQAVGYTEHHPDAENCALVVVNPSDLSTSRHVLVATSPQYKALAAEVADRIAQLEKWARAGELPDRVCAKPADARSHFCMHAAHCFDGWESPPLEEIASTPELETAVQALAEAKFARTQLAVEDKELERRVKAAQEVLEAAELPAGVDLKIGPFQLRRTAIERKASFDWERAEGAGVFEPGLYGDFFKAGAAYSTFKVSRITGEPGDYGDVPF